MIRFIMFAVVILSLIVVEPALAQVECKVCDAYGCKRASANESGRVTCTSTVSSCTISGSVCYSGGDGGCDCGTAGCSPCDVVCNQEKLPRIDQWDLASVHVIPAPMHGVEWVLAEVVVIPAEAVR